MAATIPRCDAASPARSRSPLGRLVRRAHRMWAATVDCATFELVNLIQHRHAAAAMTPGQLEACLARTIEFDAAGGFC